MIGEAREREEDGKGRGKKRGTEKYESRPRLNHANHWMIKLLIFPGVYYFRSENSFVWLWLFCRLYLFKLQLWVQFKQNCYVNASGQIPNWQTNWHDMNNIIIIIQRSIRLLLRFNLSQRQIFTQLFYLLIHTPDWILFTKEFCTKNGFG